VRANADLCPLGTTIPPVLGRFGLLIWTCHVTSR
jgi:hypothetical protein